MRAISLFLFGLLLLGCTDPSQPNPAPKEPTMPQAPAGQAQEEGSGFVSGTLEQVERPPAKDALTVVVGRRRFVVLKPLDPAKVPEDWQPALILDGKLLLEGLSAELEAKMEDLAARSLPVEVEGVFQAEDMSSPDPSIPQQLPMREDPMTGERTTRAPGSAARIKVKAVNVLE